LRAGAKRCLPPEPSHRVTIIDIDVENTPENR
jgi:hypothetical protein